MIGTLLLGGLVAGTPGTAYAQGTPASASVFHVEENHWVGMGDIAVIENNNGLTGGELYTLINEKVHGHPAVAVHRVVSGALSARFSPNGRWLVTAVVSGSQTAVWLISSDATTRENLGTHVVAEQWLPGTDTLIYSTGRGVWRVTPGQPARKLPLHLPASTEVRGFHFASRQEGALWVTRDASNYNRWFDQIGLWNLDTGSWRTLVTAKVPDGLVLGPWATNRESLFYWYDADHSASLMADGLPLYQVSLTGHTRRIGHTFASHTGVQPMAGGEALIWQSTSRYLFAGPKRLRVFPTGSVPVASRTGDVQLDPALSPDNRQIAFVYAQQDSRMLQTAKHVSQWYGTLRLATFNLSTRTLQVLTGAGTGVLQPEFNGSGARVVYVRGDDLLWIAANGRGEPQVVAEFANHTGLVYPQYTYDKSALMPAQIADYLPKAGV